jgi:nicotinate-nucleotide adenylyltransferase
VSAVRLGVFGGTFDPPHLGHLIAAQDAAAELGLERVLLVLSARPPHRGARAITPPEVRFEMLTAAVAGDPVLEPCDLELRRPGPSYTVDTLIELRRSHPEAELVLLLGVDQWRRLPTWRDPSALGRLATVAVMAREGEVPQDNGLGLAWRRCPVTRVDISATAIRERVARGRTTRHLVPEAVRALIERNALYAVPSPGAVPASVPGAPQPA